MERAPRWTRFSLDQLRIALAPEVAGVAEQLDFGRDADGEEREGDHGNGEAREALSERNAGARRTSKKATWGRRSIAENGGFRFAAVDCAVFGRTALVDGYGDPTTLAGPHKAKVLLRSCHFFLLLLFSYVFFDAGSGPSRKPHNQGCCVLKVPRFRRRNNGAKVSKTSTNGSSFEQQ